MMKKIKLVLAIILLCGAVWSAYKVANTAWYGAERSIISETAFRNDEFNIPGSLSIDIDRFDNGNLIGAVRVFLHDKDGRFSEKLEEVYVDKYEVGDLLTIGEKIRLAGSINNDNDTRYGRYMSWENVVPVELICWGSDYMYPFDEYHCGFNMDVRSRYRGDTDSTRVRLTQALTVNIGHEFAVEEMDNYAAINEYLNFGNNRITPRREGDYILKISRPEWLKRWAIFLCVISLIPLFFLVFVSSKNGALELMTAIVTIFGMRIIILGTTKKLYFIDNIFGVYLFLIFIIPLLKEICNTYRQIPKSIKRERV